MTTPTMVPAGAIQTGDPGYDEARTTFNAMIDRRPAAIIRPRSTTEVATAVRWARDAHLPIAVRGGGHSVAGHAVADGAAVIDLRLERGVVVDPERRTARVRGGALWVDVDAATTAHGLAMPGGTFADTGVGGLALGGGFGYLMGTGGLTCDTLVHAEVVTADGSVVIAGADGDTDLLWALRGGGGNFGVVTEFEFALQPIAPLYAGDLAVRLDAADEAMRLMAELARVAPPELVLFAGGPSSREAAADATADSSAQDVFFVTVVYQGSADAGEAVIRPLRALPIINDDLATRTYLEVQALNGQIPFGLRHYWKGHFVRDLDGAAMQVVVDAMAAAHGDSFILIEAITGAARQEPAGGAAFGQREAHWNVSGIAIWEDPAEDGQQIAWAREFVDALLPSSLSGAGYANYSPADKSPERVRAAFDQQRFARLVEVKRRHDPENAFRFNHNIPPDP